MRNNDNIVFIDHKGASHNAIVQSFREHRDGKNELIHHEPLVTLNYNAPPNGEPATLIDIPHIDHPHRQDNNPDLPSYPLHAWKYEEEDHLELPADHPVHDHFNEQPKRDEHGNIVPKRRPLHEAHIAAHRAAKGVTELPVVVDDNLKHSDAVHFVCKNAFTTEPISAPQGPDIGHPAHPDTVSFLFQCESCGASVTRVASHHGGKQWEDQGTWVEHVCKQEDIDAFRKKAEDAKKPPVAEPSPSERLAAGEKLSPEPTLLEKIEHVVEEVEEKIKEVVEGKTEPDVIKELQNAPPAPSETESKPEDPA